MKETKAAGEFAATWVGRGSHHGQTVLLSGRGGSSLPECCVFIPSCSMGFALVGSFWASFCFLLWSTWPQKHLLILWFRLVNLNSAKTLKISKTTHNRRSRGINRTTIHFNPLKWLLNTELIYANATPVIPPCLNFCLSSGKTLYNTIQGEIHLGLIITRTSLD